MRFVSPVALGLMLALGTASFGVSTPAMAAKEKKSQAPKLKLSPDFLPAAQTASKAIEQKDAAAAQAALAEAEAKATSNDDKYQYYSLLLNYSIFAQDTQAQNKALKGMLDTGLVPQDQVGQFSTIVANNAIIAKDYDGALAYAEKANAVGYKPEQVKPIMAQAIWGKANGDPAQVQRGLTLFKEAIQASKAAGQEPPAQWYQVGASQAAQANLMTELKDWAMMAYQAQPSGENLRTVLRVFQRENPEMNNRENLDLMRLMHTSGGLVLKPDYLEYAEMASKTGLFGEVKTAIDEGRAKGALTAADGSDLYSLATQRASGDKSSLSSAAADAQKAANGKVASATADGYMGYGEYAKAVPLYELALEKGGVDAAEVNTRLGIARAKAGNVAGAKEALAKVTTGSRGGIAKLWLEYLNATGNAPAPAEAAAPADAAASEQPAA